MTKEISHLDRVREIVNKHDPIGLLKIGCPVDEYNPEIDKILPVLRRVKSVNQLHKMIYDISSCTCLIRR